MSRARWVVVLMACTSTPEGVWMGTRECPGEAPQLMEVELAPVGGGWQGLGQVEWDDTNLGKRFLLFDLELRMEDGEWHSDVRDCGLKWGGVVEDTSCPEVSLRYRDDEEALLTGAFVGCPVTLVREG